jgi:plastocyanin
MKPTKLALLALLALLVSAASLAAVARAGSVAQTVRVTETSNAIRFSAKPRVGTVKLLVRNASDDAHDFWLRGGGKTWKTRVLGEGRSATLTVTLKKGVRYSFWCSISDHRQDGMSGRFVAR